MKSIIVVCEGPTEASFVKNILSFCLPNCIPKTIETGRDKKGNVKKGGDLSWKMRAKPFIERELKYTDFQTVVTTMFDYYALKDDFPGYCEAKQKATPYLAVEHLENEMAKEISAQNFIPYIQLHEFETLLFADLAKFKANGNDDVDFAPLKNALRQNNGNPELINTGFETSPSHRIIECFEKANRKFTKTVIGVEALQEIGIEKMRENCPHFNEWIEKLER